MFLGSKNPLLIFLQSYHVWVTSRHVTSCHVMSRHVTSCHVLSRHVTSRLATSCHVMPRHVMLRHGTSCHVESRGTVTRPTLHCQLTFSTRNWFEFNMTVFVGCPEGCRYHTASAVYDLVYLYSSLKNSLSDPLRSNGADYVLLQFFFNFYRHPCVATVADYVLLRFLKKILFTVHSQKLLDRFSPNFQELCILV